MSGQAIPPMATFSIGDLVADRDAADGPHMVVLDPDRGQADAVYIPALGATVAAVNPEHPADAPVVECVHVEWLDRHAGDRWEEWRGPSFADRLQSYVRQWRIPLTTYDYPADRLELVDPATTGERSAGQSSIDEWGG